MATDTWLLLFDENLTLKQSFYLQFMDIQPERLVIKKLLFQLIMLNADYIFCIISLESFKFSRYLED